MKDIESSRKTGGLFVEGIEVESIAYDTNMQSP